MTFMRKNKRVKTAPRIDKSELAFGIRPRLRVKNYLKTFKHRACICCGASGAVPAHIRHGCAGGMALKPDDSQVMPLCDTCHRLQSKNEVLFWLMAKQWDIETVKREAYLLYVAWEWGNSEAPALTGRKIKRL